MSEFPAPPPQPAPGYTAGPSGPRAGFFHRVAAFLIDLVIVAIVPTILFVLVRPVGILLYFLFAFAYFTYFEGSASGQTVGKRVLGIRVIDFNTGGRLSYGRAFVRTLSRILSSFFCYLGYWWMLWDKEKQTWHDKLASDVVVPVDAYPVASWPN